jgi:hypothetical protein
MLWYVAYTVMSSELLFDTLISTNSASSPLGMMERLKHPGAMSRIRAGRRALRLSARLLETPRLDDAVMFLPGWMASRRKWSHSRLT